MDKLISAESLKNILLLRADSDFRMTKVSREEYYLFIHKVIEKIDKMPDISSNVVRCKDCAWRTKFADGGRYCIVLNRAVQDDFWCASAFRKEKKDADK